MSLPESLERAASELPDLADQIRPANGDPHRLLEALSSDAASAVLGWILREEPEAAAELVDVWGDAESGAQVLLAASDEGLPRVGRKLLRRARHRLRSRGIEIAEPDPTPRAARRRAGSESDQWQEARISMPDFRGARVGYLIENHPAGGVRLFEVRFDEARGILDFKIYNAGRSRVRGFLRSLTAGSEQRIFEVGRDALRALVRRASLAQPLDRPFPTAFVEWRSRLFPEDLEKEKTPGDLVREALGTGAEAASDALRERSLERVVVELREGRLGPWPPPTAWLATWMEKGREAVDGVAPGEREAAIEAWLEAAVDALGEETDPGRLARALDEMAWIEWQTETGEELARAFLVASEALSSDADALSRLNRGRIDRLFESLLAELRGAGSSPTPSDEPDRATG